MHGWMGTWDWFWMGFMMVTWVVLIGALVYVAVQFAIRSSHHERLS